MSESESVVKSRPEAQTSETPKRRLSFWRMVALTATLAVVFLAVLAGVCYMVAQRIIRNGGYSEKWVESVDGQKLVDVEYGDLPWQKMDIFVPKELDPAKVHGAILFIHGGAWIGGSRLEQEAFARRASKSGYLTGNMEYMLYNKNLNEYKDQYSLEKVLEDVDLALAQLVATGREYGYDIERVALSGHSAGGHISMLYGFTSKMRENCPVEIAFVAPRVGPADFHAKTWGVEKDPKTMAWFTSILSGKAISESAYLNPDPETEEAINSISPVHFVAEGVPPTLAAYGEKDSLVPTQHYKLLKHAFSQIGAVATADAEMSLEPIDSPVFDLIVFPNSNHMLGRDPDCTLQWQALFLHYATEYLTTSDELVGQPIDADVLSE